jgi:type I restriction enzyme S subunit
MASSDWTTTTLGQVIELKRGYDLPSRDRRDGPYPIVSSSGVSGCHAEAKAKAPGVVIGRYGTLGEVHYITQDYWPLNTSLYVRDFKGNDPRFISYFLRSLDFGAYSDKAAVPGLNRNDLHTAVVRVPAVAEQRVIAHILGTLDDKIELNRQMNETLETIARALFTSWFVDFDPVRAKSESRDPGLPLYLADPFPDSLEDSELGQIPKGWKVGSVDDEFALTMGQSPPGNTYNLAGEGLPFYQGRADFGLRFPTRRVYCTAPTRFAKAGDTLVSVRAPVGDINMASEDCAIGRGVAAVRHKTGSRSYSYRFMKSIEEVFARFEAEGTVFGSIGKKDFHAIPCVIPPRERVLAYEMRVSPLDDRVEVNARENRTLAALRDTLLPKLISGGLPVANPENPMGVVV